MDEKRVKIVPSSNVFSADKGDMIMTNCRRMMFYLAVLALLFGTHADAAEPIATAHGLVADEKGNPLDHVTVQMCGMEEFRDGAWVRVVNLGKMPSYSSDQDGRFAIPFNRKHIRYDVWFDRLGFAPTFLYGISAESREIKVVMKRGALLSGTVTRLVNGAKAPVFATMVELRIHTWDMGYRQRAITDLEGRYTLRVCLPPGQSKCVVVFAGEAVQVHVKEGDPLPAVDFEVEVTAKEKD